MQPPHLYPDIEKNQVKAFSEDSVWISKINYYQKSVETEKYLNNSWILNRNYGLTKQIMYRYNIYNPINDFLKEKGFNICGYVFEKIDSIPSNKQLKLGSKSPILTPTPENIFIFVQDTLNSSLPIPDIHFFSDKMNRYSLGGETILDAYLDSYFPITKHKIGTRDAIDHPEYPDGGYCEFTTEYGDISVIVN